MKATPDSSVGKARPSDSTRRRTVILLIIAAASLIFLTAALFAQNLGEGDTQALQMSTSQVSTSQGARDVVRGGEVVRVNANGNDDVILAGDEVRLRGQVADDAVLAGSDVRTIADMGGNLMAAGADVRILGDIGGNILAAGRNVHFGGRSDDDIYVMAADISVHRSAVIGGDANLLGSDIALRAPVRGDVRILGGDVALSGVINGDAAIRARELTLLPTVRIDGQLFVESEVPPRIEDGAVVTGEINYVEATGDESLPSTPLGMLQAFLFGSLASVIIGSLLFWLMPSLSRITATTVGTRPVVSFLCGLGVALLSLPIIALLAMTIVGMPFAFAGLGLFFFIALAAVPLFALAMAIFVARTPDESGVVPFRRILIWLVVISLGLAAIGVIPAAGPIFLGITALFGIGGFTLSAFGMWREIRHGNAGPANCTPPDPNSAPRQAPMPKDVAISGETA